MTRLALLIAVVMLVLSAACTPQQVTDHYRLFGIDLTPAEAETISEWVSRDCLPRYDVDAYVECAVADAAARYGLDRVMLADLGWCESRLTADARNPRSSATGVYQFLTGTWEWVRSLGAPHAHEDRTHARANAFTAAWLITRTDLGGINHWVCAP